MVIVVDHDGNLPRLFFIARTIWRVSGEDQLDRSRSSLFLRCARFLPLQCRQLQIGNLLTVGLSIRCFLQFALFDSLGRIPMAQSISSHSRCRRRPELRARSALRKAAKLSTGSDFCTELIHRTSRSIALTEAGRDFYQSALRILDDIENATS